MADESQFALAALVVALVALITTISQVLSQLFQTADGYRRCQSAIIGGWAKLTTRKFRWADLRFETIYTTPRFALAPYTGQPIRHHKGLTRRTGVAASAIRETIYYPLDGSPDMVRDTFASPLHEDPGQGVFGGMSEMASWVRFIDALHSYGADTRKYMNPAKKRSEIKPTEDWGGYTIPHATLQRHSWDFVPPDVIRPLAVMTLHDVALFSRRLGMSWKVFEASRGALHAEGNGHMIDSTTVRSVGTGAVAMSFLLCLILGLSHRCAAQPRKPAECWSHDPVVQFSIRDPLQSMDSMEHLYIPSEPADKMGFGILPGDPKLHLPDYVIGEPEDCVARTLEIDRQAGDTLKELAEDNGWTPGFSDIIGFAPPMLRLRGSTIIKVPRPARYEGGLTLQEEGIIVFHHRLRDLVNARNEEGQIVTRQTRWVLQQLEELSMLYGKQWADQSATKGNGTSLSFLDDLHARHDATTQYFVRLQSSSSPSEKMGHQTFRYIDLMYSHIIHAVDYVYKANQLLNAGEGRNHYDMKVQAWITEGAHVYFDQIPKVAESMKQKGFDNPPVVEEAWFTMMLRAFLWHRTHLMVDGNRVPSQHWGSRLPVYVG
ncbi:MAG: hypothetical protein Q9223_007164 [Gallowayella weberi]